MRGTTRPFAQCAVESHSRALLAFQILIWSIYRIALVMLLAFQILIWSIYRIALVMHETLHCLCVCMVAQVHAH